MKRILILLLVAVLLFPVFAPMNVQKAQAFTEESYTYKFGKPTGAGDITAYDITAENYTTFTNQNWYYFASSVSRKAVFQRNFFIFLPSYTEHWMAIVINVPKAGYYDITFKHSAHTEGGKGNIYLIPGTDANKQNLSGNLDRLNPIFKSLTPIGEVDFYGDKPMIHHTINSTFNSMQLDAGEHILIFRSSVKGKYKHYMRPISMTLTKQYTGAKTPEELTTELSDNNGIVKLGADIKMGDVMLPSGVTLDLNGYKLTCDTFIAKDNTCEVIDSSDGGGLLAAKKPIFSNIDDYIPLYNASKSGYQIFKYKVRQQQTSTGNYARKFDISLDFTNSAAYKLMANGNSGLELDFRFAWATRDTPIVYTTAGSSYVKTVGQGNGSKAFSLNVKNIDKTDAKILTVMPVIHIESMYKESNAIICPVSK